MKEIIELSKHVDRSTQQRFTESEMAVFHPSFPLFSQKVAVASIALLAPVETEPAVVGSTEERLSYRRRNLWFKLVDSIDWAATAQMWRAGESTVFTCPSCSKSAECRQFHWYSFCNYNSWWCPPPVPRSYWIIFLFVLFFCSMFCFFPSRRVVVYNLWVFSVLGLLNMDVVWPRVQAIGLVFRGGNNQMFFACFFCGGRTIDCIGICEGFTDAHAPNLWTWRQIKHLANVCGGVLFIFLAPRASSCRRSTCIEVGGKVFCSRSTWQKLFFPF